MKSEMTSRERVLAALSHQEPDRVPVDIAGTKCTTLHRVAYQNLIGYLGLPPRRSVIWDPMQQVVLPDEDVLEYFAVDTRSIWAGAPDGFKPRDLGPNYYEDEWGVVRSCPDGGYYFDLHKCPLEGDPTPDDLRRLRWPDPDDPGRVRGLRERAEHLHRKTGYAVVLNLGASLLHTSQYMRGFEGWFIDMATRPEFMHALLDRILDVHVRTIRNVLRATGGQKVDVAFIADDLATDTGPMFSPAAYREFLKPRLKQIVGAIRELSGARILYHSCGAMHHFIDDLVECGVDAINPVQTSAQGMDPAELKTRFGDRVCFWGGIDTRRVLNQGTPEDVRAEVRRVIRALGPGGGYVLNFVHNAQPDVKPENIVAMIDAAREFGRYPLEMHSL